MYRALHVAAVLSVVCLPIMIVLKRRAENYRTLVELTQLDLGWLPGPLLFGAVFDNACLLWQDECGERGACLYYDNEEIGLYIFLLVVGIKGLSLVLLVVAWIFYKPPKKKVDDESDLNVNNNAKGLENNMNTVKNGDAQTFKDTDTNNGKIYHVSDNKGLTKPDFRFDDQDKNIVSSHF